MNKFENTTEITPEEGVRKEIETEKDVIRAGIARAMEGFGCNIKNLEDLKERGIDTAEINSLIEKIENARSYVGNLMQQI